jgi:hypothetical protein
MKKQIAMLLISFMYAFAAFASHVAQESPPTYYAGEVEVLRDFRFEGTGFINGIFRDGGRDVGSPGAQCVYVSEPYSGKVIPMGSKGNVYYKVIEAKDGRRLYDFGIHFMTSGDDQCKANRGNCVHANVICAFYTRGSDGLWHSQVPTSQSDVVEWAFGNAFKFSQQTP